MWWLKRAYDLYPDGIRVVVDWDKFVLGASVFVPCVNTERCKQQAATVVAELGYRAEIRTVIEAEKLGVRIWRSL